MRYYALKAKLKLSRYYIELISSLIRKNQFIQRIYNREGIATFELFFTFRYFFQFFFRVRVVDTYFSRLPQFADIINDAIQDLDPTIRVISEPGSYYVTSSFTLTSYLHSKRIISKDGKMMRMYYMNCGVFNSFLDELLGLQSRIPQLLFDVTRYLTLYSEQNYTAERYFFCYYNVIFYHCSQRATKSSLRVYGVRPPTRMI